MQVGEVAAASAGDEDLLANAFGVFQHGDARAALAGLDGAHQSGRASAEDDRVIVMNHTTVSGFELQVARGQFRGSGFPVAFE